MGVIYKLRRMKIKTKDWIMHFFNCLFETAAFNFYDYIEKKMIPDFSEYYFRILFNICPVLCKKWTNIVIVFWLSVKCLNY